ncbi:hypothetical protein OIU74_004098 [Salix koriyanagi]|uniref:Uncharacterized protein n=1 Tax=Salix koriyanagi TaxID=2511006 RepID=A0A9Q0UZD5_9ROSI|nr:hypothetical protein OIU74_004098 [Salix koriyanagi]
MLLLDQEMELEQNKEEETQKSLPEEESPEEKVKLNEIEEMPETESTLLSIHPRLHPGMMCEMEMPKLIGKNVIWEDRIVSNKKDDEYGVSKEETHQNIEMERVALIEKHNVENEVVSNKGEDATKGEDGEEEDDNSDGGGGGGVSADCGDDEEDNDNIDDNGDSDEDGGKGIMETKQETETEEIVQAGEN